MNDAKKCSQLGKIMRANEKDYASRLKSYAESADDLRTSGASEIVEVSNCQKPFLFNNLMIYENEIAALSNRREFEHHCRDAVSSGEDDELFVRVNRAHAIAVLDALSGRNVLPGSKTKRAR